MILIRSLLLGGAVALLSSPALRADDEDEDAIKVVKSKEDTKFSLDALVTPKSLWDMTPEKLETDYQKAGFRWLSKTSKDRGLIRPTWMWIELEKSSADGKSMRKSFDGTRTMLQFFGGKVEAEEVNFEFKNGKLALMTISVWNKGDSDTINEKQFKERVTRLTEAMNERLAVRSQELGRDTKSASKAIRTRWETPETIAQLEHSSAKDRETGFQGEFIRVRLAPKTKMEVGGTGAGNVAKVNQAKLVSRVKKLPNGDVYVDGVPMVDQGDKGYCAMATSERVMRYYGIECDQHDMAKASGSDAFGTDPDDLQEALHKLQNKFKIRVRDIIHWDVKDYLKFTDVYNREARRIGAKTCPEGYFWTSFRGLDKDALREARTKGAGYDRFVKSVTDFTSHGVPLLWGLELGIYPENGEPALQGGGGHMRLIIGYNAKKEELIFSDSWGAGHEMKRMAMKDAYVVTKGMYMIEPQAR